MPVDSPLVPALVVIAVAVSIQTLLLLAGIVACVVAWRRWQERFDDALNQTREAAVALRRASDEAARSFDVVRRAVETTAAVATAPRTLLVAGMTAAGALFARWRRHRPGSEGGLRP